MNLFREDELSDGPCRCIELGKNDVPRNAAIRHLHDLAGLNPLPRIHWTLPNINLFHTQFQFEILILHASQMLWIFPQEPQGVPSLLHDIEQIVEMHTYLQPAEDFSTILIAFV